jgi:hypothetical protein
MVRKRIILSARFHFKGDTHIPMSQPLRTELFNECNGSKRVQKTCQIKNHSKVKSW